MKAVRLHQTGSPDVLQVDDVELAAPATGEARIRHRAIGVNFIDCYHRSGLYPLPLPAIPGVEAVGVIEALGPQTASSLQLGDRVAYKTSTPGSYAEARNVAVDRLVKVPDDLGDDVVAASFVKGLTAEYLSCRLFAARAGHTAVVTAAAGGVGQALVSILVKKGVRVLAVVGKEEKRAVVTALGVAADDVFVSRGENPGLGQQLRARTHDGADVVYDSVGKDTFPTLLDAARRRGLFVSFGNASGPVAPFAPALLSAKGSLFFTRPALHDWVHDSTEQNLAAAQVFSWLKDGTLRGDVQQRIPLAEAARAHRLLESGQTTGSLVLTP